MLAAIGEPAAAEAQEGRLFDGFEGELALDWNLVRPDPEHQSLTRNPGKLTITTQYGSIHRTGRPVLAKNLFLVDVPERDESDFVVTTCLEAFRPQEPWNQAGLIVYTDDDNYMKFVCEFSGTDGLVLNALVEEGGVSVYTKARVPLELDRLWLRVIKRGNLYECCNSNDGKTFTSCGAFPWGDSPPKQVGILAKNGSMPDARKIDAAFDFFEFRSLTAEEKEDPAHLERLKLQGTWKVVAGKLGGKAMANSEITNITIEPGRIILREGSAEVASNYLVDLTSNPKVLKVYVQAGATTIPLNWAYAIDGDKLTLCIDARPNAPPPASLDSTEGDDLMLLDLERVPEEAEETG